MGRERYVVLGLARARTAWFRAVAQWATSAAIPVEFLMCVSAEELRARLAGGRPFSAALLDAELSAVDRDLIAAARDAGCVVFVVDDGRARRDWIGLGAATILPPELHREQLLDALATHATMIGETPLRADRHEADLVLPGDVARVAAVCGPGGTGASTAAIALAQGLAATQPRPEVLLADLCRNAEQAMLHDSRDIVPALQELVEAHRGGAMTVEAVLALTFEVQPHGYRLLLGLRRARYWSAVRPRAFEAAFASLRRAFDFVVCDIDADFEGEDDGGSVDVEERNLLARAAAVQADVVFAVGAPGMKGLYSLVRVIGDLVALGVPTQRILPVVVPAPRSPRLKAETAASLAELIRGAMGGSGLASPIFLPRRKVEAALRDGTRLPEPLPELLAGAFHAAARRTSAISVPQPALQRVAPGSLGAWSSQRPQP